MARRIDIDQAVRVVIDERLELRELISIEVTMKQTGDAADIGKSYSILQTGAHIVVTGDDPAIPHCRPLHGIVFTELPINRIWVCRELRSLDDIIEFHGVWGVWFGLRS